MAVVCGIHLLAHGNKSQARSIAEDIGAYNRLLIGANAAYGAGAYAWYADCLPQNLQSWPQVVFEVDSETIVPIKTRSDEPMGFFRIPGNMWDYVPIHVLEFRNLEEGRNG